MKNMKKWLMVLGMAGSTLFASGCLTQLRDGVVAGMSAYVTDATVSILNTVFPI